MSKHKVTAVRSGFTNGMDWEKTYEVTFEYRPGRPAVMYLRNGDPGYPADPAEIEAIDIKPEFGTLDSREKAEALDWANEWLQEDGWSDALEVVGDDDAAMRDARDEARVEARWERR